MNIHVNYKYIVWELFFVSCTFLKRTADIAEIVTTEVYAILRHIFPASVLWIWRKYIFNRIQTIPIQITVEKNQKTAYLNIHGNFNSLKINKELCPVLISHGDHAHPYTMLHLVDIAHKEGLPIFSLYIPGLENDELFDIHNSLLKEAIDMIENIVNNECGYFSGILGVGHSKGAILLAQRQFVDLDPRIKAICSIAGRLKVLDEKDSSKGFFTNSIKSIHESILRNSELPIMQIIPEDDWIVPYASMAVRPHHHCHIVPGMHISGLFSPETLIHFTQFLKGF